MFMIIEGGKKAMNEMDKKYIAELKALIHAPKFLE